MFKILCVGFGRMGISHTLGVLGNLGSTEKRVYIYEKSIINRTIARILINVPIEFVTWKQLKRYQGDFFDFTIISTPPFDRKTEITTVAEISKRVLVEKPVRISQLPSNCFSGYTLQYNPMFGEAKKYLKNLHFQKIQLSIKTPEDFNISRTWRNGKNGGIVNEFGGHCFTLLGLCDDTSALKIETSNVRTNYAAIQGNIGSDEIPFFIEMHAADGNVRKTTYEIKFITNTGDIVVYDNYALNVNGMLQANLISVGASVSFYLRGFDYSNELSAALESLEEPITRRYVTNFEAAIESLLCD